MERVWIYLINPILTSSQGSNIIGIRVSNFHDGALFNGTADPFISDLYDNYHPIHQAYITANNTYKSKTGLQIGTTNAFTLLVDNLANVKINAWDASIQVVYPKGSSKYIALLPNGHSPFQTGTQLERIAAASALSLSIGTDLALAGVKKNIDNYVSDLTLSDTAQKGAFNAVDIASKALELARVAMAQAQFGDLGAMINQYQTDATQATAYFDLEAIRKGKQIYFVNSVKKTANKFIVERTVDAEAQMILTNTGVTVLRFYLSDKKTGAIGATFVELAPDTDKTVYVSDLGDITLLHFLMVYNPDTINKGEYTVEFL